VQFTKACEEKDEVDETDEQEPGDKEEATNVKMEGNLSGEEEGFERDPNEDDEEAESKGTNGKTYLKDQFLLFNRTKTSINKEN